MADIKVMAWELRFQDPGTNSNKFYRLYVLDNGWWVQQWGRVGAVGQFKSQTSGSRFSARSEAEKVAGGKEAKGYTRQGADTFFTIPATWMSPLSMHHEDLSMRFNQNFQPTGASKPFMPVAPASTKADQAKAEADAADKLKATLLKLSSKGKAPAPAPAPPQAAPAAPTAAAAPKVASPPPKAAEPDMDGWEAKLAAALDRAAKEAAK